MEKRQINKFKENCNKRSVYIAEDLRICEKHTQGKSRKSAKQQNNIQKTKYFLPLNCC